MSHAVIRTAEQCVCVDEEEAEKEEEPEQIFHFDVLARLPFSVTCGVCLDHGELLMWLTA